MTRKERKKAIDALRVSVPIYAMTREKFNDYIQTLNKVMDWLEQEESILNKIRAEIEELKNAPPCFDDMFEYEYAIDDVLYIIDKYKIESEDK